ncbi:10392_t:CDS:2 [Cetraspora pellucida]|uniref:10392_t:CDS:1 n=1 Tax=Cetraspora pellucida TaxID=1433469 RepID=A0ACA9KFU5_9GLOM|nr:10392_t:CDS:2 [Cetraspora pellucida]
MSDTTSYINHVANVTSSTLGVVKVFSNSSAVVADAIVPFFPLITEISSIVNEIISLYQTAEHNKRICGSLLARATAAQTAYLREIEGGITSITDNMTLINSKLDDITQLNLAWQKKLLNNDESIFESALVKTTDLYDLQNPVKRGKISKKSLNYEDVAVKEKFFESNDQDLIKDVFTKIANFTLSRGFNDPTKNVLPTIEMVRWMAPEKLCDHEKNPYTVKCEIYSFGMLLWEIAEEKIPFENERDILEIRNLILIQKVRPSFTIGVPTEYSKISYQSMQDSPNARPALKNIFITLYSLYQKFQPKSSQRPVTPRMSTDEDLPEIDPNELALDDLTLTFNVLSMKEAIAEHRKKNGDKLKVWEAFKVHAEEFSDITARYWVGYYLYYGLCPIDEPDTEDKKNVRLTKAAALFKEAADTGLADAQLRYGHCLWLGEGIQKNIREAIEYFQKSADNGNTTALYNIGNLYYNGSGVPQDKELGIRYLRKAALQGQPKALEMCKRKEIGLVG